MLHLAGRVRLGRDVRDLLQLQRALERDRQADVAAEVEEERLVEVALRDLVDRVVAVEERLDLLGQPVDLVEDERQLVRAAASRRTCASFSATRKSRLTCAVKVFEAATLTSRPARV